MERFTRRVTNPTTGNDEGVPVTRTLRKNEVFHLYYPMICEKRNMVPLRSVMNGMEEVKLDLLTDRVTLDDWELILQALRGDRSLREIGIRSRWSSKDVLNNVDTYQKAHRTTSRPVVYTNYILKKILTSLDQCLSMSSALTSLNIEGLPLTNDYIRLLGDSVAKCKTLKNLILQRSSMGDDGVEVICKAIAEMPNLSLVDLSMCNITEVGVASVATLIKRQTLKRMDETWNQSLRYQDADLNSIGGLRRITLNGNEKIGHVGAEILIEVLYDDVFVKAVDMQNCGLTSKTALLAMRLLGMNNHLIVLDIRVNAAVENVLVRNLAEVLQARSATKTCSFAWLPVLPSTASSPTYPVQAQSSSRGARAHPYTTQCDTRHTENESMPGTQFALSDVTEKPNSQYAQSATSRRSRWSHGDQSARPIEQYMQPDHVAAGVKSLCSKGKQGKSSVSSSRSALSDSDTPLSGRALLRQFIEQEEPMMESVIGCEEHRIKLEIQELSEELLSKLQELKEMEALCEALCAIKEEATRRAEVAKLVKDKRHDELMGKARAKHRKMTAVAHEMGINIMEVAANQAERKVEKEDVEEIGSFSDDDDDLSSTETITCSNNDMYDADDQPETAVVDLLVESEEEEVVHDYKVEEAEEASKSEEGEFENSLYLKRCHSSRPAPRMRRLVIDKNTKCTKSESLVDNKGGNSPPFVEQELGDMERAHDRVVVRSKDAVASTKPSTSNASESSP